MAALNLKWKTNTGQYQTGESLYLNKILIGSYGWNSGRSRGSTNLDHYVGDVLLPSLKNKRVIADEVEDIKIKVEGIVDSWFNEALRGK